MKHRLAVLPNLGQISERFVFPRSTGSIQQAKAGRGGNRVILAGWLDKKPKHLSKQLTFAQLRDASGDTIQLIDTSTPSKLRGLKPDSILSVEGVLREKHASAADAEDQNVYDLNVSSLRVLNPASTVVGELGEETKSWPPEYRYLQLRQPQFQEILKKRYNIIKTCREVLDKEHFTEIETPLLFKSTPEGAREFLVPTRRKGHMYALPQSPQQYKQLLIASGIQRYFQVAKCFRDEDLRQDRQPEFTQLDLEMAFANAEDVKRVVENLVKNVWAHFSDTELTTLGAEAIQSVSPDTSLATLKYSDALARYGVDKPDLRLGIEIKQLPATPRANPDFSVFEALILKDGERLFSQASISQFRNPAEYQARVPTFCIVEDEAQLQRYVEQLAHFDSWESVRGALGPLSKGDAVAFCDRSVSPFCYENPTPLGRLRQMVAESAPDEYMSTRQTVACWVEDFPLFEPAVKEQVSGYPVYDENKVKATHHPFTMISIEDYEKLDTAPLQCRGCHFDLVVNGVELGGGSTRIHDSQLQEYVLSNVLKLKNPTKLFGHLIEALRTGCPPHAGLAVGLDRMIAMLCGLDSIRDVIAFPKTITGSDPMMGSPSKVTGDQLAPYNIREL